MHGPISQAVLDPRRPPPKTGPRATAAPSKNCALAFGEITSAYTTPDVKAMQWHRRYLDRAAAVIPQGGYNLILVFVTDNKPATLYCVYLPTTTHRQRVPKYEVEWTLHSC